MTTVLLIEDDHRIRESIARALADEGYDIKTEREGMEGLKAAVEEETDLVILDLGLPDMDGRQVLKLIRAVSEIPVIVY